MSFNKKILRKYVTDIQVSIDKNTKELENLSAGVINECKGVDISSPDYLEIMSDKMKAILSNNYICCMELEGIHSIFKEINKKMVIKDIYSLMLKYKNKAIITVKDLYKGDSLNKYYNLYINIAEAYKNIFIAKEYNKLFLALVEDTINTDSNIEDFKTELSLTKFLLSNKLMNKVDYMNMNIKSTTNTCRSLEVTEAMLSDYEITCGILVAKTYEKLIVSNDIMLPDNINKPSVIMSAYKCLEDDIKSLRAVFKSGENLVIKDFYKLIYTYYSHLCIIYFLDSLIKDI